MHPVRSIPTSSRRAVALGAVLLGAGCAAHGRPAAPESPEPMERIRRVESGLLTYNMVRGEAAAPLTIQERLRFYRVPGVSVAVINDGRIEWARAWGEVEAGSGIPVDTTTLFQAASISKPVAAAGVLRLVEEGVLALDEDVNLRLRSWKVPENEHTRTEKVTLRRLLSHSAGTTVHGFPGYASGEAVPSLVQLLDGEPPANTDPVRVDLVPGSRWRYSGGGTSIAQLLVTDATGRPFPELMREKVLEPAGMHRSTYAQPLPAERAREAATAHLRDGTPVPGKHHTYPEMAAAGLWTTPSDLARFAIEIQRAFTGDTGRILSPGMARRMLTKEAGSYGLGFSLEGEGDELWFSHGGSNRGFQSYLTALAGRGQGVVVMTNGDAGSALGMEILRAVAREYGLPAYRPNVRDTVELDAGALAELAGTYHADWRGREDGFRVDIRHEDGVLRASLPAVGWENRTLRPASPTTFFFLENPGELTLERDERGAVAAVVLSGLGQTLRAVRR